MLTSVQDLVVRANDVVTLPSVGADAPGVVVRFVKGTYISIVGDLSGQITNNTLLSCKVWFTAINPVSLGGATVIYKDSPSRGITLAVSGAGGATQKFTVALVPADTLTLERDQYRFDIRLQLPSGSGPYVLVEGVLNLSDAIGEATPRA
jgi:hypothetical protein